MIGGCGDDSLVAAAETAIRLATAETAVWKAETTVSCGGCPAGGDVGLGQRRRQSLVACNWDQFFFVCFKLCGDDCSSETLICEDAGLRRRHCAQTGSLGADFFQKLRPFWSFVVFEDRFFLQMCPSTCIRKRNTLQPNKTTPNVRLLELLDF